MSAFDLLDDTFPHGTPEGFRAGCRGSVCPAPLSCRAVNTRYSGDFTFRRLIDSGMPLKEILERDAAERAGIRERDRAAEREARRAAAPAPIPRAKPRTTRPKPPPRPRATPRPARAAASAPVTPPTPTAVSEPRARIYPTHPDYSWLAAARDRLTTIDDERADARRRTLDLYEDDLDRHCAALAQWRIDLQRIRAELRAATTDLETTTTAQRTGLSMDGAIATAAQAATARHAEASSRLDTHLQQRPTAPPKPRMPRKPASHTTRELQPHGTNACRARGCDRPECIEAGRTYHREWMAARRAEDIPLEYHGTAYGYQLGCKDRASCPASTSCSDASIAEERRRRREAGIPEQAPRVPAEPIRAHVRQLMTSGWTVLGIAAAADVSKTGIKILLYGRSGARKGELPAAIEEEKARRLQALSPLEARAAAS